LEIPAALRVLAKESARIYPEFVHELEDESGLRVDLRDQGTILISQNGSGLFPDAAERISPEQMFALEPGLALARRGRPAPHESSGAESRGESAAAYLAERSVDPRALVAAAIKAARRRGVDVASGSEVTGLLVEENRVGGVQTERASYSAPVVVNCAGAWAGSIGPQRLPVRPVKGQMLDVVGGPHLQQVVRAENVYLVPNDGRVVIGSALEELDMANGRMNMIKGFFMRRLKYFRG
jgi:glycine oxidase